MTIAPLVCVVCLLSALLLADDPERFLPWEERAHLGDTVNTTFGDFFPTISKDGISLYFTINNTCPIPPAPDQPPCYVDPAAFGGADIYVSRRATTDEEWGPPQNAGAGINTASNEYAPSLTIDGHRMFFASNRAGGFGGNDIYVSRRQRKDDDFGWQPAENLGNGVNTSSNESGPEPFEDDSTGKPMLYFDSNRPGGLGPTGDDAAHNGNDIYVSVRQADETFGPAVIVAELSTVSVERQPAIRRDGLEIFLTSNRPGGLGNLDVWVSTRASVSGSWSTPVNVGSPVNRAGTNDAGADLSFDGTTLYFQSGLENPARLDFDLFQATRTKAQKVRGKRCESQDVATRPGMWPC